MTRSTLLSALAALASAVALAAPSAPAQAAACSVLSPCKAGSVCVAGTCVALVQPGHADFCDLYGPCDPGEGDCDSDSECASGLVCQHNIGARYGFSASTDTCEQPPGHAARCTSATPCDVGEGDCDSNRDCLSGLVCQHNIGERYGFTELTDTCELPLGDWDRCTPGTPCDEGEGDCDTDSDCLSGLRCRHDMGHVYGYDQSVDVCAPQSLSCPEDYFPPGELFATDTRFRFPIDTSSASQIFPVLPEPLVVHVDTDTTSGVMDTFDGAHATYDNHRGTDYSLSAGFLTQDSGSVEVVAAADGVVTEVVDGNPDRCAVDLNPFSPTFGDVQCDGPNPDLLVNNRIEVCHADGVVTQYLHLLDGSPMVTEDQPVQCGEALALVGSAGNSATPHLHFHVLEDGGASVDPYAVSPADSMWVDQGNVWLGLPAEACQ